MEATLVRVCEDFSVQGYEEWSFRIRMCLQTHHILMWDVIKNGPNLIDDDRAIQVEGTAPGQVSYSKKLKSPSDYSTEERKEADLDIFAKCLISSTVKGVHLAKIRHLDTTKKMWDTFKSIGSGSKEMKVNKLFMACNKFDKFKMLPGESVEAMKIRFTEISLEIIAINKDKYTQREKNLNVISALPANWRVYAALYPTDRLISTL